MRIHTNDKPCICDVEGCGKAFRTATQLKQHKRLHTVRVWRRCNA